MLVVLVALSVAAPAGAQAPYCPWFVYDGKGLAGGLVQYDFYARAEDGGAGAFFVEMMYEGDLECGWWPGVLNSVQALGQEIMLETDAFGWATNDPAYDPYTDTWLAEEFEFGVMELNENGSAKIGTGKNAAPGVLYVESGTESAVAYTKVHHARVICSGAVRWEGRVAFKETWHSTSGTTCWIPEPATAALLALGAVALLRRSRTRRGGSG